MKIIQERHKTTIMNLDQLSDEQLAQFIDGNSSPEEIEAILDAISSGKDLETIVLALTATTKIEELLSICLVLFMFTRFQHRISRLYSLMKHSLDRLRIQ